MTVYYTLTFMLLAAEMTTFCILVFPLPYPVRKRLFRFLSESPIVAKIAYGLKISFIFVGILFLDAAQRMFRVVAEADLAKRSPQTGMTPGTESSIAARKFYAQRNTYLTGFCLFLSLVLTRTFQIILDLIHVQEEYAKLKTEVAARSRENGGDLEALKRKIAVLESQDRDFETLKKQASQQAAEYDRLAEEYNEATGQKSDKRKD